MEGMQLSLIHIYQVMKNIKAVLADMGLDYKHIVKTTIFVSDLNDFDKLNEVYGSYLEEPYPARSCVQVARLPKDVKVEIECIVIDTLVYEQQMAAQESGCSGCCLLYTSIIPSIKTGRILSCIIPAKIITI